ncbi:MAG: hypothetical protein ACI4TK_02300 [Agathobacter sp.]
MQFLGADNCSLQEIEGRRVFVYEKNGKQHILLLRSVSYLGNPHPIFKKRIQLPDWIKEFCQRLQDIGAVYDVRFIGVYHYDGLIVFVDFAKEQYLQRTMHNSSAHVYTNDIYQAVKLGIFHKEDANGNHLCTIRGNCLAEYLDKGIIDKNNLFTCFEEFNQTMPFNTWLYAVDAIKEMHEQQWSQWQQAEWAGWYLEYKFNAFSLQSHIKPYMQYVGVAHKGHRQDEFDFDIWFDNDCFYGDLKASDIAKNETPANDQQTFIDCINRYDKFWFVVYEHETRKDSPTTQYQATIERNQYIRSIRSCYTKDDMSYHQRMKHSVNFVKMYIIELNRINYRNALIDFNQGRQPDGSTRKKKFSIKKKDIDNFVVYRYSK